MECIWRLREFRYFKRTFRSNIGHALHNRWRASFKIITLFFYAVLIIVLIAE